jgi:hypothetical protein
MPVRVAEKKLRRTVGPRLSREVFDTQQLEMAFPRVEVVHEQREMIAAVV